METVVPIVVALGVDDDFAVRGELLHLGIRSRGANVGGLITVTRFCAERVTARMTKTRIDTIRFMANVFSDGEFFSSVNAEEGGFITLSSDFCHSCE